MNCTAELEFRTKTRVLGLKGRSREWVSCLLELPQSGRAVSQHRQLAINSAVEMGLGISQICRVLRCGLMYLSALNIKRLWGLACT
jgi:hypothetical protein